MKLAHCRLTVAQQSSAALFLTIQNHVDLQSVRLQASPTTNLFLCLSMISYIVALTDI